MKLPRWFRWRTDRELDEEIEAHVNLEAEEGIGHGLPPERARAAALRKFGNRTRLKENAREGDPLFGIATFLRDVVYGLRGLRRTPGFTFVATLSLALGIGANTLIFSLVNSTLLKPLALYEPDRLAAVWTIPVQSPDQPGTSSISTYFDIRDRSRSFENMGAFNGAACGIRSLGSEQDGVPAERILGQCATPSLFQTLGVKPLLGRTFAEEEDQVDYVAPVLILSYRTWQNRFAGDPQIIGKPLLLSRVPTTVIGVLGPEFDFFGDTVEFFTPLEENRTQVQSRLGGLTVVGRLKPGVSLEQAQAEVATLAAQMAASDPERHSDLGARVESLQRASVRFAAGQGSSGTSWDYRAALLMLQGAVAFVLLIGCANVAGLLLARTASRRSEVAVRIALGASRARVIRQLVTESFPLAMLGGAAGVLISWAGLALFVANAPPDFPRLDQVALDFRVLGVTALVILVTSVLFSIVPAMQASQVNLADPLKESGRSSTGGAGRQRLRGVLVSGQVALALVLLIGAGLMIHSFVRVMEKDLGGDPRNLLVFDYRLPQTQVIKAHGRYRGMGLWDINPVPALTFERLSERLQSVPGVVAAAAVSMSPFGGQKLPMSFLIEGRPAPPAAAGGAQGEAQQTANYFAVTNDYFKAMKIPLLRGRDFDTHDSADGSLVMIVNQTMARRYFPNEDPLGKFVTLDFVPNERPREVVAVVGDSAVAFLQEQPEPAVYIPQLQQTAQFTGPFSYFRTGMFFVLRTSADPKAVLPQVKRAVAELDPNTPVAGAQTVQQTLNAQVRNLRMYMLLLGIFGAVAALLAATGIYGVIAYSVAERRREIGIRMALGARATDILRMVLRQAMQVVGAGLVLGLASAFALAGALRSVLFGVAPTDLATYAAVSLVLLLIAVIACLIPARRAVSIDPTNALKLE